MFSLSPCFARSFLQLPIVAADPGVWLVVLMLRCAGRVVSVACVVESVGMVVDRL